NNFKSSRKDKIKMANFNRERQLKEVRFTRQIELLDLINSGVQTNASLIAFTGANTAPIKMKRVTAKDEAVLAETSVIFGGRGTRFYRMKDKELNYLDAKENNAISHAVYLLRDSNVILDVVKPFSLDEYSVKYRTVALTSEEEISELVFSYYDSQRGDFDYVRRFYNFDEDTLRVIVFDDVATYRRFIRNVQRDDSVNKIKDQIHVVLDSEQSLVRATNFDMHAFYIIKVNHKESRKYKINNFKQDDSLNKKKDKIHLFLDSAQTLIRATNFDMNVFSIIEGNHTELSKDNISSVLNTRKFEDKRTIKSILDDYEKAKRNAEKFESNMNSN